MSARFDQIKSVTTRHFYGRYLGRESVQGPQLLEVAVYNYTCFTPSYYVRDTSGRQHFGGVLGHLKFDNEGTPIFSHLELTPCKSSK